MFFKQIVVEGMGCMSYVIGCPAGKTACIVDPKRDVQDYLDIARQNGMKITHIFETHVHADHVSGNQELQSRTGADIYFMEGSPIHFEHKTVRENEVIKLGNVKLEFLKTPGHTPDAMSILVTDLTRSSDPWLVLTGDCMFVGDIGRPDLAGEELIGEQVENLYQSLHDKLGKLPDSIEVFPAHGEGSLCGKGMSSKPSSTVGFEKHNNPLLTLSHDAFTKQLTASFPEHPKSFSHIIATNKNGAPLLENAPAAHDLDPDQVKTLLEKGAVMIDTRDMASFGGVHIPGSYNIGLSKQTANWIGMVIEPQSQLVLVVPDDQSYDTMRLHLHRIGYDNILGYLYGGIAAWQEAGYPIEHLWQISAAELKEKLEQKDVPHFLDVRTQNERNAGYIKGSELFPVTRLLNTSPEYPEDDEIIVTCAMGYRGNIAASLLQSRGFTHVHSLAGGVKAWMNAGYGLEKP